MNLKLLRRALGFGLLAALAACQPVEAPHEPLRPVLTQIVGATAGEEAPTYSGEVRARFETALAFRIPGKIAKRLVDVGEEVKAGEALARLDPADTALSAAAARAQLDLAEAEARRYRELRGKNFVSQAALEAKETALKSARAQADLARNQGNYTVLRAEHAGIIGQVAAEAGQVVAAGQPVLRLARTDALEVAIAIPESAVSQVRALKNAEVKLWADQRARYPARLRELAPMADAATRTYAARVAIERPDAAVLLGMTAAVRFLNPDSGGGAAARLAVPLTAIFQKDGKPAVWVVASDDTLILRPVALASLSETRAVLDAGLEAGERIVIAGVHKLSAGEKIRPVPAEATAKTAGSAR